MSDAFEKMLLAFEREHLKPVKARRKADGHIVTLVCAVVPRGNRDLVFPFAELLEEDPFDQYEPVDDRWTGDIVDPEQVKDDGSTRES